MRGGRTVLDERERGELRVLVGEYLADRCPDSAVRAVMDTVSGVDDDLWAGLGAGGLGVCGLAVPTRFGGEGHTFAEVGVVLGELGRSLACVPYFSSVVLAQSLLLACDSGATSGGDAGGGDRGVGTGGGDAGGGDRGGGTGGGNTGSGDAGSGDTVARLLPRLASGELRAAVAVVESDGRWDPACVHTTATTGARGWRLTGTKHFVVDGHTADVLLVAARTPSARPGGMRRPAGDGIGIFEVDAGAAGLVRTPMDALDPTRRQARLEMTDVPGVRIGTAGWDAVAEMLRVAAAGLAAESVGGIRRVLEMAVGYAGTRSQFGRPIGSFQAIKHKCADMLVATESADSLARDAVTLISYPPRQPAQEPGRPRAQDPGSCPTQDPGRPRAANPDRHPDTDPDRHAAQHHDADPSEREIDDRGVAASLAHAYCQQAYLDCASENIQVHGGIGFTWEHPAQLYYKRAQSSRLLLGDPIFHRALAAELIDL